MTTAPAADPRLRGALDACASSLRKLAEYELEPPLERRLRWLGERKEFLGVEEHEELLALAEFARRRTLEAFEARLALKRLAEVADGVSAAP